MPFSVPVFLADVEMKPMRVHFNLSAIPNDYQTLTRQTFDALAAVIHDLVRVVPLNWSRLEWTVPADLRVAVSFGDYGSDSTVLASAVHTRLNSGDARPIEGKIMINRHRMPSLPESFYSGERQFFMTLLHELTHILVFSSSLFWHWRSIVFQQGFRVVYEDVKWNITHNFLSTPKLNEWVRKRFNIVDPEWHDIGLELEDGGGSGTADSHPNERLYLSDLMAGRTYGISWLSEIFRASMEDSGWYQVNESMIEPLCYLDPTCYSNWDKLTERAILEPPQIGFPESSYCSSATGSYCFGDYMTKGVCSSTVFPSGLSAWYNPKNKSEVGKDDLMDYAKVVLPSAGSCRDPDYYQLRNAYGSYDPDNFGEGYGPNSVCAQSNLLKSPFSPGGPGGGCFPAKCRTDDRLILTVKHKEVLCLETNQTIRLAGYFGAAYCPPAKAACSLMPKEVVINLLKLEPDSGPINGGNIVKIIGNDFDRYPDLELKLGDLELEIISKNNYTILVRIPSNDKSDLSRHHQPLTAKSNRAKLETTIPDMYLFTDHAYGAGSARGGPAAILMGIVAVFGLALML
jgi:hypothetical protein